MGRSLVTGFTSYSNYLTRLEFNLDVDSKLSILEASLDAYSLGPDRHVSQSQAG